MQFHSLGDDDQTGFRHFETLAIGVAIVADFGFGRNDDVLIDDGAFDTAVFADDDVLHDDRFPYVGMVLNPDVWRQDRRLHSATGDDAASTDNRIKRNSHPSTLVILSKDEFRRRKLALVGPDRPLLIV